MKRVLTICSITLLLILHVTLVVREFPVRVLLSGEVPLKGDVSRYFATAVPTNETGMYGYDPHFMAGYPVGLWNSMGKKGFEILRMFLPRVGLAALFYFTLVGVSLFAPLVMWWGVRRFLKDRSQRTLLLFVAIVYWHLQTMISYFWGYGNVFFPATACLAPVAIGLAWDVMQGRAAVRSGILLGIAGSAIFYGHTVVLVAMVVPLSLVFLWGFHPKVGRRRWMGIATALLVSFLLCAWWLVPLLRNAGDCVPQPHPWLQSSWRHLVMDAFSDRAYRHHFDRNLLLHIAVVAGAVGTVLAWRKNRFVSILGIGGMAGLAITYGASYNDQLSAIQPYRFMIPSVLLLLLPVSVALHRAGGEWVRANRSTRAMFLVLLIALLPRLTSYGIDLTRKRANCGLPPSYELLLNAVDGVSTGGRVFCDDMQLGHIIPYYCDRSVLGGLSAQAFVKHRFAGVDNDGRLFGRTAARWDTETLREYLNAYAVDVAVLYRGAWVRCAEQRPELFLPVAQTGGYHVYRIADAQPSLVKEGAADVAATYDRISVSNVVSDVLLLKLHYVEWLHATKGVQLKPVSVLDDPVPFIQCVIPVGVTDFEIVKHKALNRRPQRQQRGRTIDRRGN